MNMTKACISLLPPAAAAAARKMPSAFRGDFINEVWLQISTMQRGDTIADAVRRAKNSTIRMHTSCGSVSLDAAADLGDAALAEAEAGAEMMAEAATSARRYQHYVESIRKPGETRRAAEKRLKKHILATLASGDLFADAAASEEAE